jgi:Asp-tRNA(Asn)/Glu-tRNA(Gln) amidotransferase A subunit family amidase
MADEWQLSLTEAATAIGNGDITAESLASSLLKRAEVNEHLNAFVARDSDRILEAARAADLARRQGKRLRLLHGVPICVKDNIDVVGYPTTACTPALRHSRPTRDAPVVAALRREGTIVFGKNTMHELAFGITSNTAAFGAVRNPYDIRMIPGGSSGGTGAAVAARLAPAGIGTDTGGSIRVPAALCGLFGLRPTLKRWPQQGIVPIASTRDTAGPLARSVEDLRLLDRIVTGETDTPEINLGKLRLGVPRKYYWENLEGSVAAACEAALQALGKLGVTLIDVDLPGIAEADQAVSFIVALYEPRIDIPAYLRDIGSEITLEQIIEQTASADVRATMMSLMDEATRIPDVAYSAVIATHRPRLIEIFAECFARERIDATIFPTTPLTARPVGEDETVELNGARVPTFLTFIRNTDPASNAGIPGVTLPIGSTPEGLPIGLALDGPAGSDRRLLAIAAKLAEHVVALPAPKDYALVET